MKKLLLSLSLIALLSSCSFSKYIPYQSSDRFDYGYLQSKGVYVSQSSSTQFEYEPLGSIFVEVRMGDVKKKEKSKIRTQIDDPVYSKQKSKDEIQNEDIEITLNKLILSELERLGGDGIIGLNVVLLPSLPIDKNLSYGPGYFVSGMAIKKK